MCIGGITGFQLGKVGILLGGCGNFTFSRDFVPFPSQKQGFGVPILIQKHPDKAQLREAIRLMRQQGMSYREIGKQLSIDSSRVWQLFKTTDSNL